MILISVSTRFGPFPEMGIVLKKKKKPCPPVDHIRFCAPGASRKQGVSERVEGATGQEHQCGCLQPHTGGACCGTGPLLPADPGWRAQTDQVRQTYSHACSALFHFCYLRYCFTLIVELMVRLIQSQK